GTQIHTSTGTITVDGLGSHEVLTRTLIAPASMGGIAGFTVSNRDDSELRYFSYDQAQRIVTIGDLNKGVAVWKGFDDHYNVYTFAGSTQGEYIGAENGIEALRLVEQSNEFKTISPYILLTAFATAHSAPPEARTITRCVTNMDTAAQPVV